MQKLSIYGAKVVRYKQGIDAIHKGLTRGYDRAQVMLNRVREKAFRENQTTLKQLMQKSKFGDLTAAGRTGRSINRIGVMEMAGLGQFYATKSKAITDARYDAVRGMRAMRDKAKQAQQQQFSKVAFAPTTDVAPPPPVLQNVGMAFLGDILGLAGTAASIYGAGQGSERALKENIKKIGTAKSGLGIYKFNYIGYPDRKYIGAMVDEVEKIFPDAVGEQPGNYLGVNYNKIDVQFKEVA